MSFIFVGIGGDGEHNSVCHVDVVDVWDGIWRECGKQTVGNGPIFVFSASCSIVANIGFGAYSFGRFACLLMVNMVASSD